MKIKPGIYARILVDILESGAPVKDVAKRFWYLLQKNNQHKNLSEILALVDKEHARKNDLILAEVISGAGLSARQKQAIELKLKERFKKEILIKNIIKPEIIAGVVVKVDDREMDLSLSGKVQRLKKALNQKG
ncbi:MAG: F0F1 ATP synthase subunit delta [Patescibacteria group bacterium]